MKTLMIVDDHPVLLVGLSHVLQEAGYNILKATSEQQAEALVRNIKSIDMFVVDLTLETGYDGLRMVERFRKEGITIPAIIYTMHEELWNISALMESGVEGVVLKGDNVEELLQAVKIVSEGGRYRSPAFAGLYDAVKSSKGILTEKDIEVLRRLSDGESTREIAVALRLGEKAVEYHRSNILRKLGSKNMTEATRIAMRLGIIN
ncbi:MAG: response regulator transcription factor [Bacteroides sp.]|nr:response regulator transcription factor [Bacteroides sp.]